SNMNNNAPCGRGPGHGNAGANEPPAASFDGFAQLLAQMQMTLNTQLQKQVQEYLHSY
ncbi:hypothetical protein PanWU01x14_317110, partial [Parasponia andersonii]